MNIRFSRNSLKFIESCTEKDKQKIKQKIKFLVTIIEEQGIIPFRELDIKKLSGEWTGFMRLRIGRIRIIFMIQKENDELMIYDIDYRGGIYK